jgi:hypothetical protein
LNNTIKNENLNDLSDQIMVLEFNLLNKSNKIIELINENINSKEILNDLAIKNKELEKSINS